MNRGSSGTVLTGPLVGGEIVRAFVPNPLSPTPGLLVDAELREELDRALLALGRLGSVSSLLPDTALFLSMYVRKEVVLFTMPLTLGNRRPLWGVPAGGAGHRAAPLSRHVVRRYRFRRSAAAFAFTSRPSACRR